MRFTIEPLKSKTRAGARRAVPAFAAVCLSLLPVFALPAAAGEAELGAISIKDAWARATPPWPVATLAFVRLENEGVGDRLLSASSDVAGQTLIHRFVATGDRPAMEVQREGIPLPAGKTLDMRAESYHLMLLNLKSTLEAGSTVPVTLTFQKAGAVEVAFDIKSLLPPGLTGGKNAVSAPTN
ncbi:copper chaperone PCu(A)C [Rhizobiales bacterium]|uniref:copper chaperone PCu(A)C n=1 Tax=Hongsoonwoonella zoysiae TaxID=2821844 RepID=UPI00155FD0EE|nr:copper chaperone PCu(A)C [Hongsoonwoonella zoysiae]NRG19701.1 copper chaperone PCu(A)C [Hongsoonwoonella zoysiae]